MSSASGPMVPETAFSAVVFPVARFLSSYFVLMRFPTGPWLVRLRSRSLARPYTGIKGAVLQAHAWMCARGCASLSDACSKACGACRSLSAGRAFLRVRETGLSFRRVLLAKFVHAAAGIHDFLLAGIERMAI
jgi:hypothetical protein